MSRRTVRGDAQNLTRLSLLSIIRAPLCGPAMRASRQWLVPRCGSTRYFGLRGGLVAIFKGLA